MATNPRALTRAEDVRKRIKHADWFHITGKGEGFELNVNVLRMPAPPRSLVANVTAVAREDDVLNMIFGQRLPGAERMTGAMMVAMPIMQVQQVVYGNADFLRSLATFAANRKITAQVRKPDPATYPTERIVVERASLMAISFAEQDAELRLYRVSATDLRNIQSEKDVDPVDVVYPVVEIVLDTAELVHLLHSITQLVPRASI